MRLLRSLGAAVAVALCLTAVPAIASAEDSIYLTESTESYLVVHKFPGMIAGTFEKDPGSVFQAEAAQLTCKSATFSDELVKSAHVEVPLSTAFSGCNLGILGEATVKMNSCHYSLGEFSDTDAYRGEAAIRCSKAGDAIAVAAFGCTVTIPAQSLGIAALQNISKGPYSKVTAHISTSSVTYSDTGAMCGLVGLTTGQHSNGNVDTHISLGVDEGL